jgi:hypothetical protein
MTAMSVLLVLLVLAQGEPCGVEATRDVAAAEERAERFDLAGAAARYEAAARLDCRTADVAMRFLRGWWAAREASRLGGDASSLRPIVDEIDRLGLMAGGADGPAAIAQLVLRAAAAAAQSEREEMAVLLEHAVAMEALQLDAGQPGAPVLSAHEAAGELWLQVHAYAEARRAYRRGFERLGATPRLLLGLARVGRRLNEVSAACREYAALERWWRVQGARDDEPAEIHETREFLAQPVCARDEIGQGAPPVGIP